MDYPDEMRQALWNVMTLEAEQLARLDHEWGVGGSICDILDGRQRVASPDVVGSHGHTVYHKPEEGWTTQIGSGAALHAALGVPVVCDLRRLDMAFGGQGAPLVPLADEMLFGAWDVALNLGGFANLSLHRPELGRVAWDVGPANLLLNMLAQTRGLDMDCNGGLPVEARDSRALGQGACCLTMKNLPQEFGSGMARGGGLVHAKDALATHNLETSWPQQWSTWRRRWCGMFQKAPVLVTGGGAKNEVLMGAIQRLSASQNCTFHIPDPHC